MEHLFGYDPLAVIWLVLNNKLKVFSSKKIRQILSQAIDRKTSDTLLPAYTPIPLGHSFFANYVPPKMQNVASFFYEALHELGIDKFPKMTIIYADVEERYDLAIDIREQLKDTLNIDIEIEACTNQEFYSSILDGRFSIVLMRWMAMDDDPIYTLRSFRSANEEVNFSEWENDEYKRLMSIDTVLIPSLQRAEKILIDELPVIPLFHVKRKF
jgi:oligopeptide transport system substrate-binding protein